MTLNYNLFNFFRKLISIYAMIERYFNYGLHRFMYILIRLICTKRKKWPIGVQCIWRKLQKESFGKYLLSINVLFTFLLELLLKGLNIVHFKTFKTRKKGNSSRRTSKCVQFSLLKIRSNRSAREEKVSGAFKDPPPSPLKHTYTYTHPRIVSFIKKKSSGRIFIQNFQILR